MSVQKRQPYRDPALKEHFDDTPSNFFVADAKGVVVYSNNAVVQRTGYDVAQVVGSTPGSLWGRLMPSDFYDFMYKILIQKSKPFINEFANHKKDGSQYRETLSIVPVVSKKEKIPKYYIGIVPDVAASASPTMLKLINRNNNKFLETLNILIGGKPL